MRWWRCGHAPPGGPTCCGSSPAWRPAPRTARLRTIPRRTRHGSWWRGPRSCVAWCPMSSRPRTRSPTRQPPPPHSWTAPAPSTPRSARPWTRSAAGFPGRGTGAGMPADPGLTAGPPPPYVHPTAIVEREVAVGDGTVIWHHSHLRRGSSIGSDCMLGKDVFVDEAVRIGDRVKIQNNVSVYRGVELADDVFVGPSAAFTNDLRPRAAAVAWQLRATRVRRGASVGANATVLCGIEIGEYGMVGAGAVATASVRPHQLVVGNPARHHAWVCRCGEIVSRDAVCPADLRCPRCQDRAEPGSAPTADQAPLAGPAATAGGDSRIRLTKVEIGRQETEAFLALLRSGKLAGGAVVAELERAFASAHGAAHAVAVSNGTTALVAALRAHGPCARN